MKRDMHAFCIVVNGKREKANSMPTPRHEYTKQNAVEHVTWEETNIRNPNVLHTTFLK